MPSPVRRRARSTSRKRRTGACRSCSSVPELRRKSRMTEWLAGLRREHTSGAFADEDAPPDPFEQFRLWLGDAHAAGVLQANAMTLSTVDEHGHPDARI